MIFIGSWGCPPKDAPNPSYWAWVPKSLWCINLQLLPNLHCPVCKNALQTPLLSIFPNRAANNHRRVYNPHPMPFANSTLGKPGRVPATNSALTNSNSIRKQPVMLISRRPKPPRGQQPHTLQHPSSSQPYPLLPRNTFSKRIQNSQVLQQPIVVLACSICHRYGCPGYLPVLKFPPAFKTFPCSTRKELVTALLLHSHPARSQKSGGVSQGRRRFIVIVMNN